MKEEITLNEFMEKFDDFSRVSDTGNVIIHPNLSFHHIELSKDFMDSLREDLFKKIMLAHNETDELSPSTKFAIMMLEQAF